MGNTEIREVLMNAVVTLVAKGGMEEASSRSIGDYAKVNSAYIYRYFIDKEDLISRTFIREMQGFCSVFESCLKSLLNTNATDDEIAKSLWDSVFSYSIANLQKCAFIYYFCNCPVFSNGTSIEKIAADFESILTNNTKYKIKDRINLHICNNLILFAVIKIYQNNITDEKEIKKISNKCLELFIPSFKKSISI